MPKSFIREVNGLTMEADELGIRREDQFGEVYIGKEDMKVFQEVYTEYKNKYSKKEKQKKNNKKVNIV